MQLLEHQGKALISQVGVPVPGGPTVRTPEEAAEAAAALATPVVLKSQIPYGKRGKEGAVRFAATPEHARAEAGELLGATVAGYEAHSLLVERQVDVSSELYAAVLSDAATKGPLALLSTEGGIDVEDMSAKVIRRSIDVRLGLDDHAAHATAVDAGIPEEHVGAVAATLVGLYQLYRQIDAELVEINPLVVTRDGDVLALDCKLSLDPGALPRHPDLVERFQPDLPAFGTELERAGRAQGLHFIELDGDIGVLANGAGLTMETLDAIHYYGGKPANFLEIGGDAYTKATAALRLVLDNPRVRNLLINFCGAFARTDVMTEGVVAAIEELRPDLPISFTVHGTGEEEAIQLIRDRLGTAPHDLMEHAVREAVIGSGAIPRIRTEA